MSEGFWDNGEGSASPSGRFFGSAEAERQLGIPAYLIRKWAQRCEATGLYAMGYDNGGRPLYWEADLVAKSRGLKIRDDRGYRLIFEVPT